MNLPSLEIIEGEVVKVQLTAETHVAGRSKVRADGDVMISSKVVNHMRLFLVGGDGKERDFRFTNTTVGVREGHRVVVVRAKPLGPGGWLTIALYNLTTELREEQIGAFAKASRQQWMQARWRAVFWAIGVALVYWPVSEALHLSGRGLGIAIAFGILAYPFAWLLGGITDSIVLPSRQRAAEKALRKAIAEKMAGQPTHDVADTATTSPASPPPPLPPAPDTNL
jgi:hypothetical protein